jgi:gluconolactonase
MTEFKEIATGLQFPEGPVALPNGDVLVTEMVTGRLLRAGDGGVQVVAECGGSANGAAIGPDGKAYVCNSGGWRWTHIGELTIPGEHGVTAAADYRGGRIQRVDLETGAVDDVYTSCDGEALRAPNDLVFDGSGGFWFTDHGHARARDRDRTGVFYAQPDGSAIREVIFPLESPNGIGLSPDGSRLYVAETYTGRVWEWTVTEPGVVEAGRGVVGGGGRLLASVPVGQLLDSLGVDGAGNVCVATIGTGGVTVISPDGSSVTHVALPDPLVTNICFGGPDLATAYCTLSATGRLVALDWPPPTLRQ